MGEAKRRGTYEERKAQAIKQKEIHLLTTFAGFLSGYMPELNAVECPRLIDAVDEFLKRYYET